jgi:hypothetical protein
VRVGAINKPSALQPRRGLICLLGPACSLTARTKHHNPERARARDFPFSGAHALGSRRKPFDWVFRAAADTSAGDFFDQMDVLVLNKDQSARGPQPENRGAAGWKESGRFLALVLLVLGRRAKKREIS